MFDFLRSEQSKLRRSAAHWLEMAQRISDYRKDQLGAEQGARLQAAAAGLRAQVKGRADAKALKEGIEQLERVMRECGGRLYPVSSMAENVEFFLVAAIVILGLRAYFVQPFKIPTNSMWPTYYGMTSETFAAGDEPGLARQALRLATLGAVNYAPKAPADGEIMIPVFRSGIPAFSERAGRSMLVFPTLLRDYTFMVNGQLVKMTVPSDWAQSDQFGIETVVSQNLFGGRSDGLIRAADAAGKENRLESSVLPLRFAGQQVDARVFWVPTGKKVRKGDPILNFDILTGDLLFVDRISYNFIKPAVGDGFVFKTDNIISPEMEDTNHRQVRQYYVKRLVGVPGDTLEIRKDAGGVADGSENAGTRRDGQLFRNGKPIDGAAAFGQNARKDGLYPGYTADRGLAFGQVISVPAGSYYAMGDNSPRSKDSRYWGFVPEMDVVGRPLFIYFPLTRRWGPAR